MKMKEFPELNRDLRTKEWGTTALASVSEVPSRRGPQMLLTSFWIQTKFKTSEAAVSIWFALTADQGQYLCELAVIS